MSLFSKNNNTVDIDKFERTIESLEQAKGDLIKELQDARRTIASFVDVKTVYEEENNKLILAHKQEIEQLKIQLESEKKSVAKKVNYELSKIGTAFVNEEIMKETPTSSTDDIYKQFQNMKLGSVEANEFYVKNKDAIRTHLQETTNNKQ